MDNVASPMSEQVQTTSRVSDSVEQKVGLVPSGDITIDKHWTNDEQANLSKPPLLKHVYVVIGTLTPNLTEEDFPARVLLTARRCDIISDTPLPHITSRNR